MFRSGAGHLVAVGGNDDRGGDVEIDDALPDADDQWQAGEEAEGLSGEAGRAQPGWDHCERPHARRSGGVGCALTTAKITYSNVPRGRTRCKPTQTTQRAIEIPPLT